ncbi:hypothetical protein Y88_1934 [Novosphingobium nitrogenifigens DSM 19370]|uniref:Uncharacterized protein n=1 Tax=Novosphingobium nitrogenifigens DSM 19370 TaxID=983920 RepID=F1Z521_9SPHN|nr:hypothetical protein Y88_1934 [Novosphingobium nitrogenifigens DSM 19370]
MKRALALGVHGRSPQVFCVILDRCIRCTDRGLIDKTG